jgi:hypothetical protein
LEQAYIFYCDDRLLGEGLDQFDLAVGEWPRVGAANADYTDGNAFSQQRGRQPRLAAGTFTFGELHGRLNRVVGMDGSSLDHRASCYRAACNRPRLARPQFTVVRCES